MLKAGLASVTLKTKTPEEVIRLVAESDISAIEWASHVHAHEGDVALCKQILTMTTMPVWRFPPTAPTSVWVPEQISFPSWKVPLPWKPTRSASGAVETLPAT